MTSAGNNVSDIDLVIAYICNDAANEVLPGSDFSDTFGGDKNKFSIYSTDSSVSTTL